MEVLGKIVHRACFCVPFSKNVSEKKKLHILLSIVLTYLERETYRLERCVACRILEGSDPWQLERQMESFHWINRDGMTSKVVFHVLVHVNKRTERYHNSNIRFVELSENAKRPHVLWISPQNLSLEPKLWKVTKLSLNGSSNFGIYSGVSSQE